MTTQLRHGDFAQTVAEQEAGAAMVLIGKRGEGSTMEAEYSRIGLHLERILRAATKPVLIASRAFKPITKVLVAWDGQASVRRAVEIMAQDPLFAGLEVRLVTVGAATEAGPGPLASARAALAKAGMVVEAQTVEGDVAEVIATMAESEGFGLVVMGSYGHSRLRSLVLGSTATDLIARCKLPLFVVR